LVIYNDLAAFTYGAAYTASQSYPVSLKERIAAGNLDFYAMDIYKPTAKLTLTAGMRVTWNTNPVNQQGLFVRPAGSFLDAPYQIDQPLNQVVLTGMSGLFRQRRCLYISLAFRRRIRWRRRPRSTSASASLATSFRPRSRIWARRILLMRRPL
jgi:outer membrane receptor protein involved in Fe transport